MQPAGTSSGRSDGAGSTAPDITAANQAANQASNHTDSSVANSDPSDVEPVREPRIAVSASAGLRAIHHLERFLDVDEVLSPRAVARRGVVPHVALVWGRKESGGATRDYARRLDLPILYLEDGWIRTASNDPHSRMTYSLLVDREGVYYDATSPSAIERFLVDDEALERSCDAAVLDQARRWRERLVDSGITKYNAYRRVSEESPVPKDPFVLVVDQTRDDASVAFGGMQEADFLAMLEAAIDENPNCKVVVRTHPDVVAGRREGYLAEAARRQNLLVVAGVDDPYAWLVAATRVYAGTSQLGYEALLAERDVTLFGVPFYAGWGLTDDRATHAALERRRPAREAGRTLDQLFHASHVRLARYRSPVDGGNWTLGDCLDHVALQRSTFERNARQLHCVGITPWKRRYVARYLRSPDGCVTFGTPRSKEAATADAIVTWSFRHRADARPTPAVPSPRGASTPAIWRLEDGFLRSAGLGSDYTAPGSLVVDTSGLYFDPGRASDLETLLNRHDCGPGEIRRASRLRRRILETGVSKYNTGREGQLYEKPAAKTCVLVVGQVEDDESVRRGCSEVSTNTSLLQAARKARPDAWIVYRPHPDVTSGNRHGSIDDSSLQACADAVDKDSPIGACIDACDEVHTMTSLTGFEALMRGKHVVTWGTPFYAGWGLTEDMHAIERRTRRRTVDELVYCVLVQYPRYMDIESGEFVSAETMVDVIERQKSLGATSRTRGRAAKQMSKLVNIFKGLTYAP